MSENTSERTPDSGQKALEDIQPEHGALVRPQGPPTSLGPQVNPFWSEAARDEAILRACRPAHLPPESQEVQHPQVSSMSPPRDPPEVFRTMMQSLLQENARLWSEREAFAAHHGAWGPQPGGFGQQQSWFGSVLGEGMGHERNVMGAVMEALKASMGSMPSPKERGMLGNLGMPVEHSGSGLFPRQDAGFLGGCGSMAKGSLMELFNMVSGAGQVSTGQGHGTMEFGRTWNGPTGSGLPTERSGRAPVVGAREERVRRVVNLVQFKVHFLLMLKVVLVFNRGNQARVQEVLLFQVILEYTRVNFFAKEMVDKG